MVRKLFIVARGNVATYESLQRTVGREPGVEVVYDRRPGPPQTKLGRLVARAGRLLSRRSSGTAVERRTRRVIDEEIQQTGWAVVRREGAADPGAPRGGAEAPMQAPGQSPPTPPAPGAARLDHTRPRV